MNIKKLNKKLSEYVDNIGTRIYDRIDLLYENAMRSDELYKNIKNTTDVLLSHIYKVMVYSYYKNDVNHWCKEIVNFLAQYCKRKLKNSHKTLTTNQIMHIIKNAYIDYEEMSIIFLKVDNEIGSAFIDEEIDYKVIYDKIMIILPQLIDYVRSQGKPSSYMIKEIIDRNYKNEY